MVGEGGGVEVFGEADVETETDNDDDGSEREAANSTPGNEGSSADPTRTAAEEEAASSMQTKSFGACSCSPVARTQEAATQREMVGEDR